MRNSRRRLSPLAKNIVLAVLFVLLASAALVIVFYYTGQARQADEQLRMEPQTASTYAMSTIVTQTAYGAGAEKAMQEVNLALAAYEQRLSLFQQDSDIARINSAGPGGAEVAPETADLLERSLALSRTAPDAFAVTIAPLTLAWGITTDNPKVVSQGEIDRLLPLVDDEAVRVEESRVALAEERMAIDLGGIAKGEACSLARDIYTENEVGSAMLSIGGNVYARGVKPDGTEWRIGFRDPEGAENAYIASFGLRDKVIAVSGGYERFFEADGKRYIHILNPTTGAPAESDIVTVGVIHEDGLAADFYSTTLFVWGKDRALDWMLGGGTAMMLDDQGTLYVSESLQETFALQPEAEGRYRLEFVAGG